jgi:hypothetical protein
MNVRAWKLSLAIAALTLVLVGCGTDLDKSPTEAPTATTDAATPTVLTVGHLADRIAAAWETIDRYRAVTTTTGSDRGSPTAATPISETIEEVIMPNQRHQVVSINGVEQSEIVAAGGNIYGRGVSLPGIQQPNRDPEVWITINGNVLGPNNEFSGFYQSLLLPVQPPYAGLDETDRSRPVQTLGVVDINGRSCQQYGMVDTTLSGARVDILVALEASGQVCSIETRSGSSVTATIYTYDQPAEIVLPASPVPAPVENG